MSAPATNVIPEQTSKDLDSNSGGRIFLAGFGVIMLIGLIYAGVSLGQDLSHVKTAGDLPYILLAIALIIALGGQKGMGLIMLILIGTVPTAYALNGAFTGGQMASFHTTSQAAISTLNDLSNGAAAPAEPKSVVTLTVQKKALQPDTMPALASLMGAIDQQIVNRTSLKDIPSDQVGNVRNDLYLADSALAIVLKKATLTADQKTALTSWKADGTHATQFIPIWVKVAVALALGMGTMVGWKRIVRTVGEKIGKTHMTYAQGLSAEVVAMGLIQTATIYHLPVSTTHVLTSGVAGTMTANGSGLQWGTIRNLLAAWVFTLPASILISGTLFWIFRATF